MSYAGRSPAPRPPDRGSFPLDHDGECAASMREYLDCMKRARNDNSGCRDESKRYLECRMDRSNPPTPPLQFSRCPVLLPYLILLGELGLTGSRGLMLKDSLRNLGFEAEEVRKELAGKKKDS